MGRLSPIRKSKGGWEGGERGERVKEERRALRDLLVICG